MAEISEEAFYRVCDGVATITLNRPNKLNAWTATLVAEFGLAWMLPRICGLGRALDLLLTARLIDAEEAQRMGLVSGVLPDAGFADTVQAYAAELARAVSPRSTAIIKSQVFQGLGQSLPEAFRVSEREVAASLRCEDFREGVAHFLENRPASFTGK